MSDRPVPTGEPDQNPGWSPQQPPIGAFGPPPAAPGPAQPPVSAQPPAGPVPPGQVPPPGPVPPVAGVPQQQPPVGAFGPPPAAPVPPTMPAMPTAPTSSTASTVPMTPAAPLASTVPMTPAQQWQQGGGFPAQGSGTPDWEALAARNEEQAKKKRRLRLIGAAVAVVLVGAAVAGVVVMRQSDKTPVADGSPTAEAPKTPGASSSGSPAGTASGTPSGPPKAIAGPPTVGSLPASKGTAALGLGSDAKTGSVAGFAGQVLKLPSGQNSFAQSAEPIVDTNKSFTVSVRVFVDVPAGVRAAVSQGDGAYYSYALGRATNNGHNLWYFKVQLPGGGSVVVYSKGDATVNQWALLTGVYDSASKQITLYVNGAAQASAQAAGVQSSGTNAFQLGRLSSNSQWSDPWHGAVADIQAWDQVLPEADIVKIVAGPSSPPAIPPTTAWLTG
ncbi:LamG domain-containing protein [Kitasatospora sp. NPDC050467]|uniref:LamG domain-containing protein n=1 Tax=unclassified Kitasatospora TaxID=2633591 RepID=UPI00324828DE